MRNMVVECQEWKIRKKSLKKYLTNFCYRDSGYMSPRQNNLTQLTIYFTHNIGVSL